MAVTVLATALKGGPSGGATTPAINTTGANLLVITVSWYAPGTTPVVSDTKSNIWVPLKQTGAGDQKCQIYYSINPVVGTNHVFFADGSGSNPVLRVIAASGAHSNPVVGQDGRASATGFTNNPGPVLPPVAGCLIVTGLAFGVDPSATIDQGFNAAYMGFSGGVNTAGAGAYLEPLTRYAVDPQWVWPTFSENNASVITVFRPAIGGEWTMAEYLMGTQGPVLLDIKRAVIDHAASGNNTIVAAVAGKRIRVLSLLMFSAGSVTARFESGADGTALTGQMTLAASSMITLDFSPAGHFETVAGDLLNLELSAAVSVDGVLTYMEI